VRRLSRCPVSTTGVALRPEMEQRRGERLMARQPKEILAVLASLKAPSGIEPLKADPVKTQEFFIPLAHGTGINK